MNKSEWFDLIAGGAMIILYFAILILILYVVQ